jgi:hypothetical protein
MITEGIPTFSLGWMVLVALTQPKVPKFVLEVLAAQEWLDRLKLKTIILSKNRTFTRHPAICLAKGSEKSE